jgi:hypothetical protein
MSAAVELRSDELGDLAREIRSKLTHMEYDTEGQRLPGKSLLAYGAKSRIEACIIEAIRERLRRNGKDLS